MKKNLELTNALASPLTVLAYNCRQGNQSYSVWMKKEKKRKEKKIEKLLSPACL